MLTPSWGPAWVPLPNGRIVAQPFSAYISSSCYWAGRQQVSNMTRHTFGFTQQETGAHKQHSQPARGLV